MEQSSIPSMTAKVSNKPQKLDTVKKLNPGFQPARLYSIVDFGHQFNEHFNKWTHKIMFTFEFPGLMQKFYENDVEERPTVTSQRFTLSMADKSNLRPFVSSMIGKSFNDESASQFNIFSLIDKFYLVNIMLTEPDAKGNVYENIAGIAPFDERLASGIDMTPHNPVQIYYIDAHGFNSPEFAALPGWKRGIIQESQEGIEWAKQGGIFAEPEAQDGTASSAQPPAAKRQAPSPVSSSPSNPPSANNQKPKLIMIATDYTYEQYIQGGWTDETLIQHGKAKKPVAVPTAPASPPMNPAPPQPPKNPNLQDLKGDMDDEDLDGIGF